MRTVSFLFIALMLGALAPQTAQAQRVAVVNTDYILKQLPKYQAVTEEIKLLSEQWEKEYQDMRQEVEKMYKEYQAERVLLSNEQRIRREEKIEAKEREAAEYRSKRFGYQGDLFKLREEKMKPIRDEVFQAVEEVAKEKRADVIFDKAGSMVMLYTNPKFEYSDLVLLRLGVTPPKNDGQQSNSGASGAQGRNTANPSISPTQGGGALQQPQKNNQDSVAPGSQPARESPMSAPDGSPVRNSIQPAD